MPRSRVPIDVMDREKEALAEHDIELRSHDDIAIAQVEQDDVDDALGRLDLRALVPLEDVLDDQRVETQRLTDLLGLLRGRGDEVDPERALRAVEQPRERPESLFSFGLLGLGALEGHHPDRPGLTGWSGGTLPLDAHAQRDLGLLLRGRGRVRWGRGHRRRVLRRRSCRSRRSRLMRRPAYAPAFGED